MIAFYLDPQRQTCKVCGRPDKFDFNVSNDAWARIVPEPYQGRVVCLNCFDEFARGAGASYTVETLYFAGDAATLVFAATADRCR